MNAECECVLIEEESVVIKGVLARVGSELTTAGIVYGGGRLPAHHSLSSYETVLSQTLHLIPDVISHLVHYVIHLTDPLVHRLDGVFMVLAPQVLLLDTLLLPLVALLGIGSQLELELFEVFGEVALDAGEVVVHIGLPLFDLEEQVFRGGLHLVLESLGEGGLFPQVFRDTLRKGLLVVAQQLDVLAVDADVLATGGQVVICILVVFLESPERAHDSLQLVALFLG